MRCKENIMKKLPVLFMLLAALCSLAVPAFAEETIKAAAAAPVPNKGDTAWMLVATILVILMSLPGLALFYGAPGFHPAERRLRRALHGECLTGELDAAPAGLHEVPDVLVVRPVRVVQHVIPVIMAEQRQGLRFRQSMKMGEGEDLA